MSYSPIDLSQLPAPDVIESIEFETLLAERKAYLVSLYPSEQQASIESLLTLESEPLNKLLQENAYRELILRQRVNDAARALMLAYASGADLDQKGAGFNVERQLVSAATDESAAVYESDSRYRARIQLAFEGISTAGAKGSYQYHALSASSLVKDVAINCETPGEVQVTVLSTIGSGSADSSLLETVSAALNDEDVRPLCDTVNVASAIIYDYEVVAELTFYANTDQTLVKAAALNATQTYVDEHHRLGYDVTRSGLFAALHQNGVQNVTLITPAEDIVIDSKTAAYCTAITLTGEVTDV
jgi:phage-related baseplate assembly protein